MNTLGLRLKQERKRLGMTQPDFALVGGVEKGTQINYEQDKRFPDAKYLLAIAAIGADTHYVLHGEPAQDSLTTDEAELLFNYRALDVRGKMAILSMSDSLKLGPSTGREAPAQAAPTASGKNTQIIHDAGSNNNISTGKTIIKTERKKKSTL
ncbi:helix-turn-helix domain-containing protein [Collimonas sp. OK412]|jgi:transcriptional regulator with XRE-family HTH domain|uniref:helix-turn-helix domain-containing protein n=1 Tax=Collimonas sp. (strain OK412) TaxID=1801619 RepID=UPI0008F3723F|nr:helix-turn-helix transcriptional regulator [Collimonas sp. OK412]SFD28266.1 DNA-binding transcriptional regulator, XRE-family HTH domain [Collimonas sp. OK412]